MMEAVRKGSKRMGPLKFIKEAYSNDLKFRPLMDPRSRQALSPSEVQVLQYTILLILCALALSVLQINSYADSINGIGDIFNMEMFVGNTKWFEKLNFVGMIIQAGISIGGFVAAVITAVQVLITVIYFGMPSFWDTVNETKKAKTGIINYTAATFFGGNAKSSLSKGSDVIMDYLILLCPDVKRYSENADDEYESITTWFLHTFTKKCITILAISMMLNGSFMKLYMVIVDGIGVVAERFVETDSKTIVNNLLQTGANYQFGLGSTGEGFDKFQGSVCTKLYKEIVKSSTALTTDSKFTIGQAIERYVRNEFGNKNSVESKVMNMANGYHMTDKDWERVNVKVIINGTRDSSNGTTVSIEDLGIAGAGFTDNSKKRYLHIYLQAGRAVDTTEYFTIPGSPDR